MPHKLKDMDLHEIEIAIGITQLGEALGFCHNDAELIHCNVTAESIFISASGDWKLGGFHFATHARYQSSGDKLRLAFPEHDTHAKALQRALLPTLNSIAPGILPLKQN